MAEDVTLLNVQKQELFDIMRAKRIDPLQFEWTTTLGGFAVPREMSVLRSTIRPQFSFKFDHHDDFYFPECSPWVDSRRREFEACLWAECAQHAARWARVTRDEVNTVDPWKALPGTTSVADISVAQDTANTQFSYAETQRIEQGLAEIRGLLETNSKKSTKELKLIKDQIASLVESSKTMGRKDWINQAVGALITLSITLALPSDVTSQVFGILKATLMGLVQLVPHIIASTPALS